MPRLAVLLSALALQACAISSAGRPMQVRIPELEQVLQVEFACMSSHVLPPQSRHTLVTDREDIARIRTALAGVSNGWQSWGITTLPGPEMRISFVGASGEITYFASGFSLKMLWNQAGLRQLSTAEQQRLREAFPSC
jgi:hypothetical protein